MNAILVTGATGKVGLQVVSQLLGTGAAVRALTRDPGAAPLPAGVDAVRGDLALPDTLDPALDGVDSVFLIWPTLAADHAARETLEVIAKHALRIVYLSARGVPDDPEQPTDPIIGSHAYIERLIERSGLEWTLLRAGGFAGNTLMWAPQIRADGVVRWVHGAAARSLIHERDIAAVAVRALTEHGHGGATYVLTGPETLTQAEQAHIIGEAIGRPVRFEEIPPEVARQQLFDGMPASIVDAILDGHAQMVREPESVTSTVEEVTGARARTFREWAIDHADDFRPAPEDGTPSTTDSFPAEEITMTADEVADEYVSLCRQGRFFDEAMERLWSPDIVRVAPLETGGEPVQIRGSEAIEENSRRQTGDEEIHGVEIDGPFVGADGRFAVRFAIDTTFIPTGERTTVTKMSLYTVQAGAMTREEVFYLDAPPRPPSGAAAPRQ